MGGSFKCESYSDNGLDGLYLNPWQVYEGRYSCVSWSTRNYILDIEDTSVPAGVTLEISFKTNQSGELSIKGITSNGVRHVQRVRNQVVYDAVDGNRWYWQTYRHTFSGNSTTLKQIRIKIPFFTSIDDFEWIISNGSGDPANSRYLQLKNQSNFNYSMTEEDLYNPESKNWNIELEGVFGANDEALVKLAPRSINPIYYPTCDTILDSVVAVAPTESGGDSFTIECENNPTPLNSRLAYLKIKNNTAKSYCSAINFTIESLFELTISDDIESSSYTEIFDIITEFK
ncbi:hypothetical protein M902_2869 [Bacteriovorax sp. BAL6_X]|uniref:hypothetical protein n=1 Tax=Bacteriovorax sp. BAL6_X TaxID=1201290 RepID=UPI0003867A28|nr:hypothetical protein [Bacteriovorax sp. BAL6_X]EPZ51218.1 hypothetical protein M902_2869 [Bacteriovorax sp. BAL6_X]